SVGQSFHVKIPIGANPFPIDFRHYELSSVFRCEPNNTSDGVCNIITPSWWMIDTVFSTSAPSALQPAKLIFQLLVIQQFNLATAQNGDQVQVQVALVQLRQLVSDAVLGELRLGPFTPIIVAEHSGHAVELQEVAEFLGYHRWVKRWLARPYGIDDNALTIV